MTLDITRIPRHIAIIPDGNRRWAMKQQANPHAGHKKGSEVAVNIVRSAGELGVKVVTLYTFSTENWSRSKEEVDFLMSLLIHNLADMAEEMVQGGVRLHTIGDLVPLTKEVQEALLRAKQRTAEGDKIDLVLAINYGGRDEICRAFRNMMREGITEDQISEAHISRYLDTAPWGDPELIIRTSGEQRLSNFMLWQACYSELYVTDTLWPDFTSEHLYDAIKNYQGRIKRLGA